MADMFVDDNEKKQKKKKRKSSSTHIHQVLTGLLHCISCGQRRSANQQDQPRHKMRLSGTTVKLITKAHMRTHSGVCDKQDRCILQRYICTCCPKAALLCPKSHGGQESINIVLPPCKDNIKQICDPCVSVCECVYIGMKKAPSCQYLFGPHLHLRSCKALVFAGCTHTGANTVRTH